MRKPIFPHIYHFGNPRMGSLFPVGSGFNLGHTAFRDEAGLAMLMTLQELLVESDNDKGTQRSVSMVWHYLQELLVRYAEEEWC